MSKVEELKAKNENLFEHNTILLNENERLKKQIEKMKCCGNCENGELSAHEEPCLHCQRCFASKDVTDQENIKDNWEIIKEIEK